MVTDEEMQSIYSSFFERILDVEEDPGTAFLTLEGYQNQPLVSLSAAIQRLNDEKRSISYDLSVVKERISALPADNLNTDESTAIYLYTMGKMPLNRPLYECLNDALRAKDKAIVSPYFLYLKLFITALSKLEPAGPAVYRGIKAGLSEKYPVGKTFVWSGFSSCTPFGQMLWSEHFLGEVGARTFFKINCSNGKNIRQHSSLSTEDEVILLPGTKFKVISKISPSTDLHIIEIQEIVSSTLLRPHSLSCLNEMNELAYIETSFEQNNTQRMNIFNELKSLSKKIEEQRNNENGDFSSLNLNDKQVSLIANEIKTNNHWRMLKLDKNKIDKAGMAHLSAALVLNSTLETIFLDGNSMGDYGTRLLSDALIQNFTLVSLTLAGNEIKDLGAKSLAELLRDNSTLAELSLEQNNIGDNGMIDLCETLEQYNRTLKKLWINNNNISDKSVEAIVAFRTMNHVLDDFKFDGNHFSQHALNTIQAANKKHNEIVETLSCINEVVVVYLELKCAPEKRLSRDASFLFTNFRRLLTAEALDNFTKIRMNSPIYLILCCEDDSAIRLISSFSLKRKISLYVLQTTNQNTEKTVNIFNCEESMMFRLTMHIANQYRSVGDQIFRMNEKDQARVYFQQGIDIQQRLVNYLKKRRINLVNNPNGTCGIQRMSIVRPTPSSIVILFDPFGKHITLDEDRYLIFHRFTTFDHVVNLINSRQYGHIDLHVPTTLTFECMRRYLEVYIHTYFVDNEDISVNNDTQREKIRDSIRICCEIMGEEFIKRGIMESDGITYQEGISLAEQLRQNDLNQMNRLYQ